MEVWQPAYIGLGSNLDDPRARVLAAVDALAAIADTRLVLTSPLYSSRPFGPVAQADYVNAVAGLLTRLGSAELLARLRSIECQFGRPERHERWGPRVLDLDILVFGRERRQDPQLTLPHPGIVERNFVLYPLADIAADLEVPGLGRVSELKSRLVSEGLQRLS
jgi:2-amino-4-hydroxy-6-hydroxymethyldihydropteridine diphosphokinase